MLVIDDEPPATTVIETYAGELPGMKLLPTFEDAVAASEHLRYTAVDLQAAISTGTDVALIKSCFRNFFRVFSIA
ncbi:hypothetical protein FHW36_1083 [Chitinophaga polysaccharea]|uniref:Uncharacterized protein n=1 Tax=Chitinophaga polysaccharea TaxID=1293035 RepID=A0A561PC07_9BACT|nr:hypothetical protein [Chitinophaga polysaccharea]TWF35649.1 hypothetical protein FHW36_1083 [Chitinophaga polysaccharea]